MENQLDAIRLWFESEEGKESIERSREQERQAKVHETRWIERLRIWIDKNSADAALEKLMKWYYSDKYVNREYKMGFEPRQNLIWLAWEYTKKYGVECDDEKYFNPFTWHAFYLGTYVVQLMNGQGSAIRIDQVKNAVNVAKRSQKEKLIDRVEKKILSIHSKHQKNSPGEWARIAAVSILDEIGYSK